MDVCIVTDIITCMPTASQAINGLKVSSYVADEPMSTCGDLYIGDTHITSVPKSLI